MTFFVGQSLSRNFSAFVKPNHYMYISKFYLVSSSYFFDGPRQTSPANQRSMNTTYFKSSLPRKNGCMIINFFFYSFFFNISKRLWKQIPVKIIGQRFFFLTLLIPIDTNWIDFVSWLFLLLFYGPNLFYQVSISDSTKADLRFYVSQVYDSITPSISRFKF